LYASNSVHLLCAPCLVAVLSLKSLKSSASRLMKWEAIL
jgi:hypothetical protein